MPAYKSGSATVTTTPALLVTVDAENDGVLVTNTGAVSISVGGPAVTVATGIPIAANATLLIPSIGGVSNDLWAVAASATAVVNWLMP